MYRNDEGTIAENYPDAYLNIYPVSAESIPVLHFYPNGIFLLVSTIGCNFSCEGCISEFQTTRQGNLHRVLTNHTPGEIITIAREGGCRGITFCLNEPTVSLPTFLRVAHLAKKEGFLVGCSSNGYMTEETLKTMLPYLDFVNIGLKGSSDERYRECGALSADPVYRNIRALHDAGVAVEVSVMYLNGREAEVTGAAERISAISPDIPLQLMRFIATRDDLAESSPSQEQGEQLCETLRGSLHHVYLFNTLATKELDSRCPVCGNTIIHRVFFGPMAARVVTCLPGGTCSCGYRFPCKGEVEPVPEGEVPVLGGYRSIMGIRVISDTARALGVVDDMEIDRICNTVIENGYLRTIQVHPRSPAEYLDTVRYVAALSGREKQARRIAACVEACVAEVLAQAPDGEKTRVLAVMSHPLLPMYAVKPANLFVEMSGGRSLNREAGFKESTSAEYTVAAFNALDPEVIIVAGHSTDAEPGFSRTCRELGISCRALETGRVHGLEVAPGTGPADQVLTLMDIANIVRPDVFHYNLAEQRERLEREMDPFAGDT
jgi:pyruvate-formate lyase-activating enzyme